MVVNRRSRSPPQSSQLDGIGKHQTVIQTLHPSQSSLHFPCSFVDTPLPADKPIPSSSAALDLAPAASIHYHHCLVLTAAYLHSPSLIYSRSALLPRAPQGCRASCRLAAFWPVSLCSFVHPLLAFALNHSPLLLDCHFLFPVSPPTTCYCLGYNRRRAEPTVFVTPTHAQSRPGSRMNPAPEIPGCLSPSRPSLPTSLVQRFIHIVSKPPSVPPLPIARSPCLWTVGRPPTANLAQSVTLSLHLSNWLASSLQVISLCLTAVSGCTLGALIRDSKHRAVWVFVVGLWLLEL